MKLFTLVIAVFAATMAFGQIDEMDKTMSLGIKNAFVVEHEGAKEKHVTEAWKAFMKKYGKSKYNRKAKQYESLEASMTIVAPGQLGVYLSIDEGEGMSRSFVFVDNGEAFVSSEETPEQAEALKTLLVDYKNDVYRLVVEDELKEEEKKLKGFNKDLEKLTKDNEKLHEDIKDYEAKIAQAEEDIVVNLKDQDNKNIEIENQGKIIEAVKEKLNNIGKK